MKPASAILGSEERGYDLVMVDEVAAEAGIAKASLYNHFTSKASLAAATMIRLLDRALQFLNAPPAEMPSAHKLEAVLRWALDLRLERGLPLLPSTSPMSQKHLRSNREYVARILALNERISATRYHSTRRSGRESACAARHPLARRVFLRCPAVANPS